MTPETAKRPDSSIRDLVEKLRAFSFGERFITTEDSLQRVDLHKSPGKIFLQFMVRTDKEKPWETLSGLRIFPGGLVIRAIGLEGTSSDRNDGRNFVGFGEVEYRSSDSGQGQEICLHWSELTSSPEEAMDIWQLAGFSLVDELPERIEVTKTAEAMVDQAITLLNMQGGQLPENLPMPSLITAEE